VRVDSGAVNVQLIYTVASGERYAVEAVEWAVQRCTVERRQWEPRGLMCYVAPLERGLQGCSFERDENMRTTRDFM